jgi:hypothetical protein
MCVRAFPTKRKWVVHAMFLAREIFELEKCKLDGRPSGFGIPYRFYVGIKTEFFDFIEQNRTFDSLGEDLGHGRLCTAPRRADPAGQVAVWDLGNALGATVMLPCRYRSNTVAIP